MRGNWRRFVVWAALAAVLCITAMSATAAPSWAKPSSVWQVLYGWLMGWLEKEGPDMDPFGRPAGGGPAAADTGPSVEPWS